AGATSEGRTGSGTGSLDRRTRGELPHPARDRGERYRRAEALGARHPAGSAEDQPAETRDPLPTGDGPSEGRTQPYCRARGRCGARGRRTCTEGAPGESVGSLSPKERLAEIQSVGRRQRATALVAAVKQH